MEDTPAFLISTLSIVMIAVVLLILNNKFHLYSMMFRIAVLSVCHILLLLLLSFFAGGIDSGMPVFFVTSIVLIFTVRDTGIGIEPEDLEKLFSDYNQVNTQSNRRIEGTGLGLSITKRLTEMMNGSIAVRSEYGKGSTFTVRIQQKVINPNPLEKEMAGNLENFKYAAARREVTNNFPYVQMPYAGVLVVDDISANLDKVRSWISVNAALLTGEDTETGKEEKEAALSEYTIMVHGIKGSPYGAGTQKAGKRRRILKWLPAVAILIPSGLIPWIL
jgi:hypothetical protein